MRIILATTGLVLLAIGSLSCLEGGNGGGYGGACAFWENSVYYRWDAKYGCGPASERRYVSKLDLGTGADLIAYWYPDGCTSEREAIWHVGSPVLPELELPSRYNPELLGYRDGIYVAYWGQMFEAPAPDAVPADWVETWCRSKGATRDLGVDVVVRTNMTTGARTARVMAQLRPWDCYDRLPAPSDTGFHQMGPVEVSRAVSDLGALTYSAPDFDLVVEAKARGADTTSGRVRARVDWISLDRELVCRTVGP